MLQYALRRLLGIVPVMILVTLIVFTLNAHVPGDPGRIRLGQRADPVQVEAYNRSRGYLDPFFVQYARYVRNVVLHLDFGESDVKSGKKVREILVDAFAVTGRLAILGTLVAAFLGIGAGVISAAKSRSIFDHVYARGGARRVDARVLARHHAHDLRGGAAGIAAHRL